MPELDVVRANQVLSDETVTVGPFQITEGELRHVADDGRVLDSVPLEGAKVRYRGERSVGGFVLMGLVTAGVTIPLALCGGTPGLCVAAGLGLPMGVLTLFMLRDAPELAVSSGDRDVDWPIGEAERHEVALLAARFQQPEGTKLMAQSKTTHHLFFTEEPPDKPEGLLASMLIGRDEEVMRDTVTEAQKVVSAAAAQGMNSRIYALGQHLEHARFYRNIPVEPDQVDLVKGWLSGLQVVALRQADWALLDNQLRVLAGPDATPDPEAKLAIAKDARRRRQQTTIGMEALGLRKVPLPPLRGEKEVQLRTAQEVAQRVLALGVVAMRASTAQEGMQVERAQFEEMWGPGLDLLTPTEALAFDQFDPERDGALSWRFEALATLAWAIGWLDDPPPLNEQQDPGPVTRIPRELANAEAIAEAALRPAGEILDLLDAVICRRWIAVDARINGRELPAGINPSVLLERHYALNWLTNHGWADWDEVDCPT